MSEIDREIKEIMTKAYNSISDLKAENYQFSKHCEEYSKLEKLFKKQLDALYLRKALECAPEISMDCGRGITKKDRLVINQTIAEYKQNLSKEFGKGGE